MDTTHKSWFWLHDNSTCSKGCGRPRHIGDLCGLCFAGATAVDRSIALLLRSCQC